MTTLRTRRGVVLSIALFCSSLMGSSAQRLPVVGEGSVDKGPVAGATQVQVSVYVRPAAVGLNQFLKDVQDTSSASYHRWLTPAEFGSRFGLDSDALKSVRTFAENNGLKVAGVSASGLRVMLSGTATQMEAAFAPGLHAYQVGGGLGLGRTQEPVVPEVLSDSVAMVGGFHAAGMASPAADVLEQLSAAVEANDQPVVALTGAIWSIGSAGAFAHAAEEAAAQGITVLVDSTPVNGLPNFAASGDRVLAVAVAPGLSAAVDSWDWRPEWQVAAGLPDDAYRHQPDVTASSLSALAQAIVGIEVSLPKNADGSSARLGNLNATLYAMASRPGVYTQPDGATGVWEPTTGLGLVNVGALAKFFPRGVLSDNVSISASNYAPTHGQTITLTSIVSDTSGQGNGVVPTGSVTFTTSSGQTLGSGNLVNGSVSVSLNSLPGGTYSVTANYSGDGTYQAAHSVAANISVQGEQVALSANVAGSVPVGGTITVNATAQSTSGVGTPSGSITVQPQGTSNSGTYTGTLAGTNGTATATITLPATQAGSISLLVSCVSPDPSFTCFTPVHVNVTVTQTSSTTTLTVNPNPPVAGQTTTFTASVTGAALPAPMPTGNVLFFDNGLQIGSGTLTNGTAIFTSNSLIGTTAHSFTASYVGDANYTPSSSPATTTNPTLGATTTTLTIAPNPPVYGTTTTLTATVGYTSIGTFPTGTVTFFQDGLQVGTGAMASNGTAIFTSTTITGTSSHVFYAKYNGDTNYASSTSPTVPTQSGSAVATTTSLSISPNPPVNGSQTTLTATVAYTSNGAPATGTVQFYEDGSVIGSGSINAAGVATYSNSAISSTTVHSFYAKYAGDVNYQPSQSNTVVTQAGTGAVATSTSLTSSATQVTTGGTVTFTATVTPQSVVNGAQPTGTVTFTSSTQGGLGTIALSGSTASLQVALTAAGSQNISATYNGDTNYQASTSSTPVTVTVGPITTPLTLVVTPPGPGYQSGVTAVASVTGVTTTNGAAPTGTVTFTVSGTTGLGATVAFTPGGATAANASYTFAAPNPGTYSVTASCTSTNFTCPTTVTTAPLVTVKGVTVTTLTALPQVPVAGQPTLLTATITAPNAVAGTTQNFTGTVTFYVNGTSAGTGTITGNAANVFDDAEYDDDQYCDGGVLRRYELGDKYGSGVDAGDASGGDDDYAGVERDDCAAKRERDFYGDNFSCADRGESDARYAERDGVVL